MSCERSVLSIITHKFALVVFNTHSISHLLQVLRAVVLWVRLKGHQHPPAESFSQRLQKLGFLGYAVFSGFEVSLMTCLSPLELSRDPVWV